MLCNHLICLIYIIRMTLFIYKLLANRPFLFTFTPNLNNEEYELQLIKR